MKEGTGSIAIEEFFGLKPMMSLFLADNDEHKKQKGLNKKVFAVRSHDEYKDVLSNKTV